MKAAAAEKCKKRRLPGVFLDENAEGKKMESLKNRNVQAEGSLSPSIMKGATCHQMDILRPL